MFRSIHAMMSIINCFVHAKLQSHMNNVKREQTFMNQIVFQVQP